jgi:hypothetical protein
VAAANIIMTTNTAANTLESQHLTTTDVEEGDGLILHQNLPRDPAVDVWNRGFCLFCVASTFLVLLAAWQFIGTTVVYDIDAKWRPVVDIINASDIEELKYVHDVGEYGLQGLCFNSDSTLLYEFHTLGARVLQLSNATGSITSLKESRVYTSDEFPLIYNKQVAHIGGIDFAHSQIHGDEVWIATHSDGIDGEGAIIALDPLNLNIKTERMVRMQYNLDWVAHHDGVLYFGIFFNVKAIKRVLLDSLEPLPDLVLELPLHLHTQGINYVQSAAFDPEGRLVLLGDDYQCTIHFIEVKTGKWLKSQPLLLGSETDGITFNKVTNSLLVGFNREHSHEQVMGEAPMVSVIELQLF